MHYFFIYSFYIIYKINSILYRMEKTKYIYRKKRVFYDSKIDKYYIFHKNKKIYLDKKIIKNLMKNSV